MTAFTPKATVTLMNLAADFPRQAHNLFADYRPTRVDIQDDSTRFKNPEVSLSVGNAVNLRIVRAERTGFATGLHAGIFNRDNMSTMQR